MNKGESGKSANTCNSRYFVARQRSEYTREGSEKSGKQIFSPTAIKEAPASDKELRYSLEGELTFDKIHHANNERRGDKDAPANQAYRVRFGRYKMLTMNFRIRHLCQIYLCNFRNLSIDFIRFRSKEINSLS